VRRVVEADEADLAAARAAMRADIQAAMQTAAEEIGRATGQTADEALAAWRARHPPLSERLAGSGLGDLERFMGAFAGGDPHGANNDKIDADLAREYAGRRGAAGG
jgi:hypothetical protein